jgi:hypothetical protein
MASIIRELSWFILQIATKVGELESHREASGPI